MGAFKLERLERPVSEHIRVRRSTVLLAVCFVGLGVVYVHTRPDPDDDPPERVVVVATTSIDDQITDDP